MRFRPSYGAMVRLMLSKYIDKRITPSLDEFRGQMQRASDFELPPVLELIEEESEEG
jgi:hypothetical protein